jgi:ATP-binding cassette subfamily B protein
MTSRLVGFARPHAGRYATGLVLLLVTNGLALWLPWLLRDAIRAMERGEDLAVIGGFAAAMAGVAVAQAVVRVASRLTILGASRHIAAEVRERFFERLLRLGATYYDTHRTGDIMSRGVNDVQLLQSFYGPGLMNLMNTAIVYVAVIVLLVGIDPVLTAVSLALFPFLVLAVNRMSRRVYARSLAVQEQLGSISDRVQENLSGIQQVKIYVQEQREIEGFRALCAEYRRRNLSMAALRGAMVSLIGIASGVSTLVVLLVGGWFVMRGRLDFADFVAFNAYLALLAWPTIALGWIINVFQRGAGAMQRVSEVLDERPDVPSSLDAAEDAAGTVGGDIEIRGLTFSYGGDRPQLADVSLRIPAGSRVALVGAVGSGKSTLANLIARLYPVPPGTVFVGGRDVNHIPLAQLRRSIGYVPQEAFLFSRTLRENIALGAPAAGDDEIGRAVELSHLTPDLETFPRGLDTTVGERGFTLSGGQRQRTTLARAVVGDRSILILDDSLSSVDADTERTILDQIHRRTRDRTLVLISHRMSTLARMDRIVVLDRGRIVEEGTHDELLARKGTYEALFRRHELERRLAEP